MNHLLFNNPSISIFIELISSDNDNNLYSKSFIFVVVAFFSFSAFSSNVAIFAVNRVICCFNSSNCALSAAEDELVVLLAGSHSTDWCPFDLSDPALA